MYREGLSFYKNDKINYTYTFPFATPISYESTIYYGGFICKKWLSTLTR